MFVKITGFYGLSVLCALILAIGRMLHVGLCLLILFSYTFIIFCGFMLDSILWRIVRILSTIFFPVFSLIEAGVISFRVFSCLGGESNSPVIKCD